MNISPEMLCKSGSESAHGKALCCWAALNMSKYPELKWLTHIPNGGWRDHRTALNLKAEGVKAGVPDYLLAVGKGKFPGLFIELKRPKSVGKTQGQLSAEQRDWIEHLLLQGFAVMICYGWEDARDVLIQYLEKRL